MLRCLFKCELKRVWIKAEVAHHLEVPSLFFTTVFRDKLIKSRLLTQKTLAYLLQPSGFSS